MESSKKLSFGEKFTYGLGAVAKDMVYMLSASYILYYYQDIMGVSAWAMGVILLAARVFDAFNDPIMGVVVAKTRTRWGKFRPWLLIGTLTNAVILYLMFACPPALNGAGLTAYAAVTYILWGVTYTMMDIPYWSMVPAFTESGKDRENLSAFARSAAGVGSALVSIVTVGIVAFFGAKFSSDTPAYNEAVAKADKLAVEKQELIESIQNQIPEQYRGHVEELTVKILEGLQYAMNYRTELEVAADPNLSAKKLAKSNEKIEALRQRLEELDSAVRTYEDEFVSHGVDRSSVTRLEDLTYDLSEAENAVVHAKVPLEKVGYKWVSLIIAVIFIVFIGVMCCTIKEKSSVDMKNASVGEMFKALIQNDQAMTMVIAIVCINTALYITSNLVIYFFKYDFSPAAWESNYQLFNTFGGGFQILAMMLLFPLLRKTMSSMKLFYTSFFMAFAGYVILLAISFTGTSNFFVLVPSAFLIMSAIGMLNVIVTVFLANTVDYGELKNYRRDESVIFSMQTFVVKLASGLSAFIAGLILSICHINKDALVGTKLAASSSMGLRLCMTIIPMVVLVIGVLVFKRHYILTDKKLDEINAELKARHDAEPVVKVGSVKSAMEDLNK